TRLPIWADLQGFTRSEQSVRQVEASTGDWRLQACRCYWQRHLSCSCQRNEGHMPADLVESYRSRLLGRILVEVTLPLPLSDSSSGFRVGDGQPASNRIT